MCFLSPGGTVCAEFLSSPFSCQEEQDISLFSMSMTTFSRLSSYLPIHLFGGLTCKVKGLGSLTFFEHSHCLLLCEEQCQERGLKETLPSSSPGGRFIRKKYISFNNICRQNGYNCGAFILFFYLVHTKKQKKANTHFAQSYLIKR